MVRKGFLGDSQPITPGHEIVGRVEALGSEVKNRKIGEIVGVGYSKGSCNQCKQCLLGFTNVCFSHKNSRTIFPDIGGFSTHMYAAEDWTFQIPNNLQLNTVPPLLCAGITMWNPLETKCRQGDKVAIIGIGGLGHLALMLGQKLGLELTAVSSSDKKEEEAKKLGATNFIVSTKENLKKHQATFDVVIIAGGGPAENFESYLKLSKLGGKVCVATVM